MTELRKFDGDCEGATVGKVDKDRESLGNIEGRSDSRRGEFGDNAFSPSQKVLFIHKL